MTSKPKFITFTGADDKTSVLEMAQLADAYPVEFGILMSPARAGTPRFPTNRTIDGFRGQGLRLSAHVCGAAAREVEHGIATGGGRDSLDLEGFLRLQLNTTRPIIPGLFARWARNRRVRPILQCRVGFPITPGGVAWLFDQSGGRGASPRAWPAEPLFREHVGYAGGLGPDTIAEALPHFREPYWIDMEARVRNERDEFDIGLCRRVCELVYG